MEPQRPKLGPAAFSIEALMSPTAGPPGPAFFCNLVWPSEWLRGLHPGFLHAPNTDAGEYATLVSTHSLTRTKKMKSTSTSDLVAPDIINLNNVVSGYQTRHCYTREMRMYNEGRYFPIHPFHAPQEPLNSDVGSGIVVCTA